MSSDPGAMPAWQFSIRHVLKDSFLVLRCTGAACAVIAVGYIMLWHLAAALADDPRDDLFSWWNFAVRELVGTVTWGLASAVLIHVVLLTLGGRRPSLRDLPQGLSSAAPVILVLAICSIPGIVSRLVGAAEPSFLPQIAITLVAYVVAAFLLAAPPAVVAEGVGPITALKRSVLLTAGWRWQIFGLLTAIAIVFWVAQLVAWHVGSAVNAAMDHTGQNLIFWIGDYVLSAVQLVFWSIVQTVTYALLRLAKEGASAQEFARVFD